MCPARRSVRSFSSSCPVPMHDQLSPSFRHARDREVEPLVRGERRQDEVIVFSRDIGWAVEVRIHRRMDDDAVPAVAIADAVLHDLAVGDEVRHPRGRAAIPFAQAIEDLRASHFFGPPQPRS